MVSFGENLRREREMRGISLEEIAAATKISVHFLESLEGEDFDRLPGGIFNRGFARAYARYLGLDEDKFLADYGLIHRDEHDVRPILEAEVKSARTRIVLFAVVCVFALAGMAWGGFLLARRYGPTVLARFVQSANTKAVTSPATSTPLPSEAGSHPGSSDTGSPESTSSRLPAPPIAGPAPAGSQSAGQTQGVTETASVPLAQTSAATSKPVELDLQIDAIGETRVTVMADGVRQIDRLFHARDSRRVKAKEIIELQASDASAVVLTLNGETLPPLGRPGESRSLTLTRKDLKGNP